MVLVNERSQMNYLAFSCTSSNLKCYTILSDLEKEENDKMILKIRF